MGTQRWKEAAGTLLSFSFPGGSLLLPWLGSALCYNQAWGGSGMSKEHPQEMCSYRATLAGRPRGPHRRGGSPHGPASGLAAVTSGTGSDTSGGTASFLE